MQSGPRTGRRSTTVQFPIGLAECSTTTIASKTTFCVRSTAVSATAGSRPRGRARRPITSPGSWPSAMSDQRTTTWPEAPAAADRRIAGGRAPHRQRRRRVPAAGARGCVAVGGAPGPPAVVLRLLARRRTRVPRPGVLRAQGPEVVPGRDHRLGRLRAQQHLGRGRWPRPAASPTSSTSCSRCGSSSCGHATGSAATWSAGGCSRSGCS